MVARNLFVSDRARKRIKRVAQRHSSELPDPAAGATPVTLPIDTDGVKTVASDGFPVWEPLEALQLRNHRITLAYCDLSLQLAALIAGSNDKTDFDANWCTFAGWSSRTIGLSIDALPVSSFLHTRFSDWPAWAQPELNYLAEEVLSSKNGAIYRGLAIGNRLVFLEIGTAVAQFIASFAPDQDQPPSFDAYWAGASESVAELAHLDPSWVSTGGPDIQLLKQGMQAYHRAMTKKSDSKARSELVLAGNIFVGAYEQHRVDVYLTAILGLFTTTWLDRIMRGDDQGVTNVLRRMSEAPISTIYASVITRYLLFVELPTDEQDLRVGHPVPPVAPDRELTFPTNLQKIQSPVLQALLTHYDRSDRESSRTRARNWARYPQRMNYITNLFRSRQKDLRMFDEVWERSERDALLAGHLYHSPASRPRLYRPYTGG